MYAARKAFMEEEASEKLWRAIKGKTRVSTGIIYQPGDLVYYKRDDLNQWKSPVTVLGRENKQILVKHGGFISEFMHDVYSMLKNHNDINEIKHWVWK